MATSKTVTVDENISLEFSTTIFCSKIKPGWLGVNTEQRGHYYLECDG